MDNNNLLPNASNYIITNMNNLAGYARNLSQYRYITENQQASLLNSADNLEKVRNKWQNGKGECLIKSDIAILYNFANILTKISINRYFASDSIYDRLARFWSSVQRVPDERVAEVVTGQPIARASFPPSDFDKIKVARENTNLMINTVVDRNYGSNNNLIILDIPTILLTIMIRSEAHEYTLGKILERAQVIEKNTIDIPDLLSVVSKVPKGDKFKPDTRAIRDATAHAKFEIKNNSALDFIIYFKNTDEGYTFERTFSRKELLQFYQDYDRMTIIYTRLLTIRLLYSFLNMNFVYNW